MIIPLSPTQIEVQDVLRNFLLMILPSGTQVVSYQDNKTPEPTSSNWVMMTPEGAERLSTNVETDADCSFTAAIAGIKMTVSAVEFGSIVFGAPVFGPGVAVGTVVTTLPVGGGATGDYGVSISQAVASRAMAAGLTLETMGSEVTFQLDFHSGDSLAAGDMAQTVSVIARSPFGVALFNDADPRVTPLHADDPRQAPFVNDQQQYEKRWIVTIHLQVNQTLGVPQQYADSASVEVISVDATYPPS